MHVVAENVESDSGQVKTDFGRWEQTEEEVNVIVDLPSNPGFKVKGKDVAVVATPTSLAVSVFKEQKLKGDLFACVSPSDMVWTIDDNKLHITLIKALKGSTHCWTSLFKDGPPHSQYTADPWTLDNMRKQLTRERFQRENPGMDFSGAEVTGNYQGGGPELPS
ncbi:nudC domain-containing protein 2-like isoform X2 [Symsagittifera roscoffensis]|uniref:nudC domain-containing protein 2-like isoform X2 n=1 Tax=Symsagittifera roscoffensis TaxID=84072 RepID=UPI00307BC38F